MMVESRGFKGASTSHYNHCSYLNLFVYNILKKLFQYTGKNDIGKAVLYNY